MNSVAYVDLARGWAKTLEDRESARSGTKLPAARLAVAERAKVPAGLLRSLRKNRIKGIAVHWYESLRAAVVRDLQEEMRRLQHEQNVLIQTGVDPRSDEAAAVASDIAAVRLALGLGPASEQGGGDG